MKAFYVLLFALHADSTRWIKLSPMKKDYVTENSLAYLTSDDYYGGVSLRFTEPVFSINYSNSTIPTPASESETIVRDKFNIGGFTIDRVESVEPKNVTVPKILQAFLKNLKVFSKIPTDLNDKTEMLENIHNNLLKHIDSSIRTLWPSRVKRGVKDDHHIDFPSSETALMTISFLTFAVYLIKLVLQMINILKNKKQMLFTPMVSGTGKSFD